MIFILGLIVGLLLAIVILLVTKRYEAPIERKTKQLLNNFKEKGEIFEETDEEQEFNNFLNNLPKE